MVLFNGMIRYYSLQQAKLSILNEELSKNRVAKFEITNHVFYLQCIQSTEIIKLTEQHIQYLSAEDRMLALIKAELKTEYDLEISSQKPVINYHTESTKRFSPCYPTIKTIMQVKQG